MVHAVLTLNNKRTKIRERERERERDKKKKKKGGVVKTKQKGWGSKSILKSSRITLFIIFDIICYDWYILMLYQ